MNCCHRMHGHLPPPLLQNSSDARAPDGVVAGPTRFPTSAAHNGRSVQYQQNVAEIRKEIAALSEELESRGVGASGGAVRGPIYIV